MIKFWLASACALCLTGCQGVNNERFSSHVNTLVQAGLTMDAAVRRLEADGFACGPAGPAPSTTCTRTRQALSPSTCIERVNLIASANSATVARVDIPAIACAGF